MSSPTAFLMRIWHAMDWLYNRRSWHSCGKKVGSKCLQKLSVGNHQAQKVLKWSRGIWV